MQFTMKATAWMLAGILAMGAFAPAANACTLPYIDDVNDWGAGKSIATVIALGHDGDTAVKWKAADTKTHKAAKVTHKKKNGNVYVGMVVMKHGHVYKISVKAKSHGKWGKWKSVGYCVY